MKQFLTVFVFELTGYLKNKLFIGLTLVLVVGIALALSFPRIEAALGTDAGSLIGGNDEKTVLALKNETSADSDRMLEAFASFFGDAYEIKLNDEASDDDLEEKVKSGDYNAAIVIKTETSYKYIVDTVGMYDVEQQMADRVMLNTYRYNYMANLGMTETDIGNVLLSNIDSETVITGKDQTQSFLYTYAIIMVLYMVLLLYGQFVSNGVAVEKSSRAMEVLITSAKPVNLMFGKVLGAGCAGLIQVVAILFTAYGFFKLNENVVENDIIKSIFGMPLNAAIYAVVFFVLGFFIYAFMFGAAGSLATRIEDLNTLTMPVTFIYMATFLFAIFGMTGGGVDGMPFKVCSFLPTFAPMVMLVRVCMGTVQIWEIALSIAIQIATIVALGFLCAKIYRAGVLMYGNTPKPREIFKILKNAETMK